MENPRVLALAIGVLLAAEGALAAPRIYVTNQATNTVHVLGSSDGLPIATIPVGQAPTGIALDYAGTFAYVANRGGNSVSRIDLATNAVTATIPVSGNPTSVVITPDGATAYVVQSTECEEVDPQPTPSPTATASPTPSPTPLASATPSPTPLATATPPAPTPGMERVCRVAAIDTATDTVVANIAVGGDPFDVAVSPSGGFVYVTNRSDDSLSVIDTSTNQSIGEVAVGTTPEGVAAGGGEIYVTNDTANSVTVIRELDLQVVRTVPVGAGPLGIAVAPDGLRGVVSNDQEGSVSIFETGVQTTGATVTVGSNPAGIAIFPDSTRAVVANTTSGTITVFGLDGIPIMTIEIFGSPAEVAVAPEPKLTLSSSVSPLPAPAGGTLTVLLVYANLGSGVAAGAVLAESVPENLTFVSATGGGALVGDEVVWDIGTIPAGGSGSVTATFEVASLLPTGTTATAMATLVETTVGQEIVAELAIPIESNPAYDLVASAPNPFVADGQATYTITYSNLGTAESIGTQLFARFDPALALVTATPLPDDPAGLVWNIGSLPVGTAGTITVTVDVGSPLANGSTLTTEFEIRDSFGNRTVATAANTVQSAPQLTLAITDIPDPAPADGVVLYEVVYSNPGTDSAFDVVLNLGYDAKLTFFEADVEPDTLAGDTWTIEELGGGESGRVRIQARLPAIIADGTVLTSSATITDNLGNTASASVDTTAQSAPLLNLVVSDSPDPVLSGDQIIYLITYSNTGGDTATGVSLDVTYPPGVAFVSATPPPDVGVDNQWSLGELAAGASASVSIVVDAVSANGSIATLTGVVGDDQNNSATATASTVIDEIPALTLGLSGTPDPVQPGGLITYVLDYGNTGTQAATGVTVALSLPAGMSFVSADPLPDAGGGARWTLGTLPIASSGAITVRAVAEADQVDGTLLLSAATLEDDAGNLVTDSATSTVARAVDLALAGATTANPVAPGGFATYTIAYGNPGEETLVDAMLALVYDPGLSFQSATPPPASATNDFWLLGDIPPGGGGRIEVTTNVTGGVTDGSTLATEVALSDTSGKAATVAVLSRVTSAPGLSLSLSSVQEQATPAGVIDVVIDYRNDGATALEDLSLAFDPSPFSEALSILPPAASPTSPVWSVGSLAPGAAGSVQLQLITGAPAGRIINLAASATGVGESASVNLPMPAGGTSEMPTVGSARLQKRPPGKKGGAGKVFFQSGVVLPPGFDTNRFIGVTVSSPSRLLAAFRLPPGTLAQKGDRFRAKKVPNLLASGGELSLSLSKKKKWEFHRLRVKGTHQELPYIDSRELQLSIDLGESAFASTRTFTGYTSNTTSSQRFRYKGD